MNRDTLHCNNGRGSAACTPCTATQEALPSLQREAALEVHVMLKVRSHPVMLRSNTPRPEYSTVDDLLYREAYGVSSIESIAH